MSEKKVQYTEALNPNSVEIKMSAKGEATFNVKSYGKNTEEAMKEAIEIFDKLKRKYIDKEEIDDLDDDNDLDDLLD